VNRGSVEASALDLVLSIAAPHLFATAAQESQFSAEIKKSRTE
jgi:hypothetical protein